MKRVISILMAVCFIILLLPFFPETAKAADEISISEIENTIENYYNTVTKNGEKEAYWNAGRTESELKADVGNNDYLSAITRKACNHNKNCSSNTFTGQTQCLGFTSYLTYIIFGITNRADNGTYYHSVNEDFVFQPGDLIYYDWGRGTPTHSMIVSKVEGDTVYFIEANWGGNCHINKSKSASMAETRNYVNKHNGTSTDWDYVWRYNNITTNGSVSRTQNISNGYYTLSPKCAPDKVLDVDNASLDNQANIQIWESNNSDAQKWEFTYLGDGYYKIISKVSGKALDVRGGSKQSGTNVQQYGYGGAAAQKWKLTDAGDGYYYISPQVNTGLNLDVYYGKAESGTNVQVFNSNGGDNQKWRLTPTSDTTYIFFDVNGNVDGEKTAGISECGTFDIYIDDFSDGFGVSDYFAQWPAGTYYNINNIKAKDGYEYIGESSITGRIEKDNFEVVLSFKKTNDKNQRTMFSLPKVSTYVQGQFTDIPANQWYTGSVAEAFEMGLMRGIGDNQFGLAGNVSVIEAIVMASRIHSIYNAGTENFNQQFGSHWYDTYLNYAYENGIINEAYYNSEVTRIATRREFAEILANSLPDEGFYQMNSVSDNSIPYVAMEDDASAAIYKLYRAGILSGSDARGVFYPESNILRVEAAAIISRIANTENRKEFAL